jgi:AraC-like DNA-binding protein
MQWSVSDCSNRPLSLIRSFKDKQAEVGGARQPTRGVCGEWGKALGSAARKAPGPASVIPRVSVFLPDSSLRTYVTFYYFVTAEGEVDDFLYPEWGNVRFALSGDWRLSMDGYGAEPQIDVLFGPTDRCARVTTSGGRTVGFGLTPLGWRRLIGEPSAAMANRVRPLTDELGVAPEETRRAFARDTSDEAGVARFDDILTALLARRPPEPAAATELDDALRSRPDDVVAFAAAIGVSPRTLQRLCLDLFGFAPKRLIRRQRFLDTLGTFRAAVGQSLEAALDPAYFDQAHFYRDFRDFMGMSPRAYFTASRALMARAAEAQAAAGVTLSFKLPPSKVQAGRAREERAGQTGTSPATVTR